VAQAVALLKERAGELSEGNTAKSQLLSLCSVARNIVDSYQPVQPLPDALARMTQLPEALSACKPPLLARRLAQLEATQSSSTLDSDPMPPPLEESDAIRYCEWGFDVHTLEYSQLPKLAFQLLCVQPELFGMGLVGSRTSPQFDRPRLWRFVREVAARYHDRPFHNFRHAMDVLLACISLVRMIQKSQPEVFMDSSRVFSLFIAGLVHDIDHPGCMSNFLIATNHPLAVLYNGRSTLENHHAATAIALLQRPECDFLVTLDPEKRAEFISRIQSNVLATDVTTTIPALKQVCAHSRLCPPSNIPLLPPRAPPFWAACMPHGT
jgi:hypothetical protein